jgi:hypothetical protein
VSHLAAQRKLTSSFKIEKSPLALDAATEAGERAISADHAMAWHDDGNRIAPVRGTDRAYGRRSADGPCQVRVADSPTIGNVSQCRPHPQLKGSTCQAKRKGKGLCPPREISVELSPGLVENAVRLMPCLGGRRPAVEVESHQSRAIRNQHERPDRRGVNHDIHSCGLCFSEI